MNMQTTFTAPQILRLFRQLDDYNRHAALQLLIREFPYAEDEADAFLAEAASELHPDSEELQDRLYPFGRLTMQASRDHRIALEARLGAAEARVSLSARLDAISARRV
jgi:hypothetical protein